MSKKISKPKRVKIYIKDIVKRDRIKTYEFIMSKLKKGGFDMEYGTKNTVYNRKSEIGVFVEYIQFEDGAIKKGATIDYDGHTRRKM